MCCLLWFRSWCLLLNFTGTWRQNTKLVSSPSLLFGCWGATGYLHTFFLLQKVWRTNTPNVFSFWSSAQRGAVHRFAEHCHHVHSEEGKAACGLSDLLCFFFFFDVMRVFLVCFLDVMCLNASCPSRECLSRTWRASTWGPLTPRT